MSLPESLSATGGQALQAIIDSPADTLIATDFDGTLAPIVEDPAQASADPTAVAALGRLGHYVGTVVVITGRAARTAVELGGFREIAGFGLNDRAGAVRGRALERGRRGVHIAARVRRRSVR